MYRLHCSLKSYYTFPTWKPGFYVIVPLQWNSSMTDLFGSDLSIHGWLTSFHLLLWEDKRGMANKQQPAASTMTTKTVTSEKPERENDARKKDSVSTSLHQGPTFLFWLHPRTFCHSLKVLQIMNSVREQSKTKLTSSLLICPPCPSIKNWAIGK